MTRTPVLVPAGGAGSRLGPLTGPVLLGDVVVRPGARVARAVPDERTEVGAGATAGRADGGIAVTARDDRVAPEERREEDG